MPPTPQFVFDTFRLDPANARLWREEQVLDLTPKAFAVLVHLVTRPDQLVTKEALLDSVWADEKMPMPPHYIGSVFVLIFEGR